MKSKKVLKKKKILCIDNPITNPKQKILANQNFTKMFQNTLKI